MVTTSMFSVVLMVQAAYSGGIIHTGTRESCNTIAGHASDLFEADVLTKEEYESEEFCDTGGETSFIMVLPADEALDFVARCGPEYESFPAAVCGAKGNCYGTDNIVFYDVDYGDDIDDCTGFQPTCESSFGVGEQLVAVVFHESAPGGWTVCDKDFTRTEYWQEGTTDDT